MLGATNEPKVGPREPTKSTKRVWHWLAQDSRQRYCMVARTHSVLSSQISADRRLAGELRRIGPPDPACSVPVAYEVLDSGGLAEFVRSRRFAFVSARSADYRRFDRDVARTVMLEMVYVVLAAKPHEPT
jgi:hypothetical protein